MTDDEDVVLEKKHSEWLVMVYLAGDNNLSSNAIAFLQELEAANHNPAVRVLAGFDSATPLPKGARYVEIKREIEPSNPLTRMDWDLHNDMLSPGHIVVTPDFCGTLSVPPKPTEPVAKEALARFLRFARRNYSANRYMLVLFGHGTLVAGNTFLADTNPPSYLKLDDFGSILKREFKQTIDILAFDNCVMNGMEIAAELYPQVKYTIGSQGLMLTVGWPFRKILEEIGRSYRLQSNVIADRVLRICARNLLDFTLMERSSEQAIIDMTKFANNGAFVSAVRALSVAMQDGLQIENCAVKYRHVRDVIRLARLEAQSYFGEMFVDLYDFCVLLVRRSNDILHNLYSLAAALQNKNPGAFSVTVFTKQILLQWPDLEAVRKIAEAATNVINLFHSLKIVPAAYYVCPELQYSHGLSVFFPWTMPERPITFEPVGDSSFPREFEFRTPFEVYEGYKFSRTDSGDWARFLKSFFRATLRNVRRHDATYGLDNEFFFHEVPIDGERVVPAIDLQKSSSDTGDEDECDCPRVKNYPRRFYLSPYDCDQMGTVFGLPHSPERTEENFLAPTGAINYLGWNIRGLVAEVIGLPPSGPPTPGGGSNCPDPDAR